MRYQFQGCMKKTGYDLHFYSVVPVNTKRVIAIVRGKQGQNEKIEIKIIMLAGMLTATESK